MKDSKRKYYSSRNKKRQLNIKELLDHLKVLFLYFKDRDYFKEKLGISSGYLPEEAKHKAFLATGISIFPLKEWSIPKYTEDNIFDAIEFLYDHTSKPGPLGYFTSDTGFNYQDYEFYEEKEGREEFIREANNFLEYYKDGFELMEEGNILALVDEGINLILNAEIISHDFKNIETKVNDAIIKWRNRKLDLEQRKQAIRDLADVFEWLKKTEQLKNILNKKDESAIFEIANKLSIRHHDPNQVTNYDKNIWYSWMFHFYLATYHATIRLIKKENELNKK